MQNLLLKNIASKGVVLTDDEAGIVLSSFSSKKFRRRQYILQSGDVATHDNFILSGLARMYKIDEKGHEQILKFTPEDWWTGDLGSFLTGNPSQYNVDCIEDTEVLRITYEDLDALCDKVPKMNKYFRLLYQKSIEGYAARLNSTLNKSALERYEEFFRRFPHIHQRVPDYQIASYLGITPQSLSRLRNQSATKN